jgi:hypothetical protein
VVLLLDVLVLELLELDVLELLCVELLVLDDVPPVDSLGAAPVLEDGLALVVCVVVEDDVEDEVSGAVEALLLVGWLLEVGVEPEVVDEDVSLGAALAVVVEVLVPLVVLLALEVVKAPEVLVEAPPVSAGAVAGAEDVGALVVGAETALVVGVATPLMVGAAAIVIGEEAAAVNEVEKLEAAGENVEVVPVDDVLVVDVLLLWAAVCVAV